MRKAKVILCFTLVLSGFVVGCFSRASPRIPRTMPPSGAVTYSIKNLGTLGGSSSAATAINASGQVVGEAMNAAGEQHAFLYSRAKMRDLGTLHGYAFSRATDINASGQVVGWVGNSALEQPHAFFYSEGRMRELGTLRGKSSKAWAINAAGDIAGETETATGERHAFLYAGGRMRDLGILGGAYGLNDAGRVVGVSGVTVGHRIALVYDSDKLVTLDTSKLAKSEPRRMNQISEATGINSAGQVVGFMGDVTQFSSDHAFLYGEGELQDLGTLGGNYPFSEASAINARGEIVGMSGSHPLDNNIIDAERAFLYSGGQMKNLRTLVGEAALAASGFKALLWAHGINDRGQIVGTGMDFKGNNIAFLLTPMGQK